MLNGPAIRTWNAVCPSVLALDDEAPFTTTARDFQRLLDRWEKATAKQAPQIIEGVKTAVNELHTMIFEIVDMDNRQLVGICSNMLLVVKMGNIAVPVEYDWDERQDRISLLQKVMKLMEEVRYSALQEPHKRNILEALDEVVAAITDYHTTGSNRITDALYKAFGLVKAVSPVLSSVGISVFKLPERIQQMLPEG